MSRVTLLASAATLLCAGCGLPAYVRNRGADLADCAKLEVGYGGAADCEARLTDWLSTGLGVAASKRWGFDGRRSVGFPGSADAGRTYHYGFPVMPVRAWLGIYEDEMESDGALRFLYTDVRVRDSALFAPSHRPRRVARSIVAYDLSGSLPPRRGGAPRGGRYDACDLELGATLLASARAGFSVGQFLDFLAGWLDLDPAGDDR